MVTADLAGVAAVECENPSPWSLESLAQELEVKQAWQFVAESSGSQIIGWCACRIIWPEGELLKIAVRKKDRGRGLGQCLVEHLVRELKQRKVVSLFLEVRSGNQTALNFYRRYGFVQVGVRPDYYCDPPDSAIILKKNVV